MVVADKDGIEIFQKSNSDSIWTRQARDLFRANDVGP